MYTAIHWIIRQPRRSIVYGLFALLVVLLLLFAINEKNWRPLKNKSNWKVSSNYSKAGAKFAIDKDLETYWTSYVPVTSGIFFQVDMGTPTTINAILFDLGEQKGGHPVHWVVKTSLDGEQWQTVVPTREITYQSFFAIIFPARENVRYLQVIHASTTSKRIRWVISELYLFQPIVPWQFERSSLIFWIVGTLFAIGGVFMLTFFRTSSGRRDYIILSSVMLIVMLIGWGLRIYDIGAYEFSAQEFQIVSALNVEEARHSKWLSSYFQQTESGISVCILLCIRWIYQFFQDYAVAIRTVPAIFSVLTVMFLGFLWKKQASELSGEEFQNSSSLWELLFVIIWVSLSIYPVLLSRRGEFAASLLFFLLFYLFTAYRFLYQQGGHGWLPLLVLLLFLGSWVEPAMLIVPAGIVLFEGIRQIVNRLHIGQTNISQKSQLFRDGLYLLSFLPLYAYWREYLSALFVGPARIMFAEFLGMLQAKGFSWIAIWVLISFGCIGLIKMLSDRKLFEWFLVFQCVCVSTGAWFTTSKPDGAVLILLLGLCWIGTKGLVTLLSVRPIFSARISFFCKLSVSLMLAIFLSAHTVNSLFIGSARFPYISTLYEQYRQERGIQPLIHTLLTDSGDCNSIAAFDELMAEQYSVLYPLHLEFIEFPEARRLAGQGRFWPYLLLNKDIPEGEIQHFLEQYYVQIERSANVILYKRRDQSCALSQRYIWEDLYRNVGRHIKDKQATSQFVRVAKKGSHPGLLTFGPSFPVCCPGRYIVRFVLRSTGGATEDVAANLKVAADTYHTLARLQLTGRDFPDSATYYAFDLPFELDMTDNPAFQKRHLQYFVEVTGKAEVRLDYIELIPQF
ncbi:LPXTG-motif cell wall anchor domain protein [Candidatus Vecturithrix granuli]|uniref:LPXTG-motif cell wall anchor domain protein n=1 Tax=Vecturithrix granuli TaxID=1499967 RepID=A0A081C0I2_VECG1|nr:LPXTG-motif cell wall anchor domain protein [Candidatus Vecturithrix granuli]